MNGGTPDAPIAVAVPFACPQFSSVCDTETVGVGILFIVTEVEALQPAAVLTVTVYIPAASPLIVGVFGPLLH